MEKAKEKMTEKCPDKEFVSCFFDDELAGSTDEAKHIKKCPKCGETIDAYQELETRIKEGTRRSIPANLQESVKAEVRRRLAARETMSALPFSVILWRAAVIALLLGGAAWLGTRLLEDNQPPEASVIAKKIPLPEKQIKPVRPIQHQVAHIKQPPPKSTQPKAMGTVNINDLANALKPVVLPGESIRAFILKEGKEKDQGVAYLDDGTVVVEGTIHLWVTEKPARE